MAPLTQDPSIRAQPTAKARQNTIVTALMLGMIAREALGSAQAARQALEHALDLAEGNVPLLFPPLPGAGGQHHPWGALTNCEARVLRYLPSHLSTREIAAELYLSVNTVKTHQRHLYTKLSAHTRAEAVEKARSLGLLAPGN